MIATVIPISRAYDRRRPVPGAFDVDGVLSAMQAMFDVAKRLRAEGFVVIAAGVVRRPEILVHRSPRMKEILASGQGRIFLRNEREQKGEFFGEGEDGTLVRVVWSERLTS